MKRRMLEACILVLFLAAIGVGVVLATGGNGSRASADPTGQTAEQDGEQNAQEPAYQGSIQVPEQEPQDLNDLAGITPDQARDAALKDNPGASVNAVKLDNENGSLVWSVKLSNGTDVKVDAGNGAVLSAEQPGTNDSLEANAGNETENQDGEQGVAEVDEGR